MGIWELKISEVKISVGKTEDWALQEIRSMDLDINNRINSKWNRGKKLKKKNKNEQSFIDFGIISSRLPYM